MKPNGPWISIVIAGLAGFGNVASASDPPEFDELPAAGVVMAEGCGLDSTASPVQQRRIGDLSLSAARLEDPAGVDVDYPLAESIFPPDLVAPTFLWHDGALAADRWLVDISFAASEARLRLLVPGLRPPQGEIDPEAMSGTNEIYQPTPYQASARAWTPDAGVWETIRTHSVSGPARVTFFGFRRDDSSRVVSRGETTLTTSRDPVGAPIFYRDVPLSLTPTGKRVMPLPKGALPLITWRLRDLSLPASRVVMKDMPSCANCHSFSADGRTLGMDIDGPTGDKGAYAVAAVEPSMVIDQGEIMTWNSFDGKPQGHRTLGFMSRVSPDGQIALSTVNESIFVANFDDYRFNQVFYPTRGILAFYSRADGTIRPLPGADDPEYVHTNGVWTPDGKTIVFARAEARDPYVPGRPMPRYAGDPNETPMRYDLYRIPFDEGRGGRPEPIAGASDNGMSNSFPKVSPDGKWLVFVKARNGQLMRPDSTLWIVPVAGGEARRMRCNTSRMNSWHSFSPNGRWMVFSSKANTPYTQMFLTHIDEDGNDSPAVLIPNATAANRATNIPEFVNIDYDDLLTINVPAVDHYRHYHRGNDLAKAGRLEEAVVAYGQALESTTDSRIHNKMSQTLIGLGRDDLALGHVRESLDLNPYNYEVLNNLAFLLSRRGTLEEARVHLDSAIRLYPDQPRAWYNRGMLSSRLGDHDAALADLSQAIRLRPGFAMAYSGRGTLYQMTGDDRKALADLERATRLKPDDSRAWYFSALSRERLGDLDGALRDVTRARETASPDASQRRDIDLLERRILTARETPADPAGD